ncbi:hypothetical protein [Paenibacillus odorifer]|uniref:Uncharacterized protein n=1 Tax=Paenibacillus odorifer TaxID=189426 RepID=A0A1R0X9Q0_9BACL|nr:hypothetical protein [Paenibacillus odorifer]OMD31374.1 hypothetical protein BJP51_19225 [Paenibacillus odorifer]
MTEPIKNGLTPGVEARIREIVREEIAAHKEQPEYIGLSEEKKKWLTEHWEKYLSEAQPNNLIAK